MGEATVVAVPEEKVTAIQLQRATLVERANGIEVVDDSGLVAASGIINAIAEARKRIQADFAPAKRAAQDAHKAVVAQEKGHLDALAEPDRIIRGKVTAYSTERERVRQEEERRLREEARKLAEEEAERERERLRAEAEAARTQEAETLAEAGYVEEAGAVLGEPVTVPEIEVAPVALPIVPKARVEGAVPMVERWHFEIVSEDFLPRDFLMPNEQKIRAAVQLEKGSTVIPGVRVWKTIEPRAGGRF